MDTNLTLRLGRFSGQNADMSRPITFTRQDVFPPQIQTVGSLLGNIGIPVTITAVGDDNIDAHDVTFFLSTSAPASATVNTTTGEFTWTPTENGTSARLQ